MSNLTIDELREIAEALSGALQISVRESELLRRQATNTDLMLAAILLGRFLPLAPHHCAAIRERLHEMSDNELIDMVHTGKGEGHDPDCDAMDRNPDGIRKPCNCGKGDVQP